MEKKKGRGLFGSVTVARWWLVLLVLLCLLVGGALTLWGALQVIGTEGLVLLQGQRAIDTYFVGEYDKKTRQTETMNAMVASLGDRWSYYLTPEANAALKQTRSNTYVGIGISVDMSRDDGLTIVSVNEDTPAEAAGLQAGEIIRGVNGTTITAETKEDCRAAIAGDAGTRVRLEVESTQGDRRTVTVTRQEIKTVSGEWTLLPEGVGLITLHNFYEGSGDWFAQAVTDLQAQGAEALVVDVRNNPGGFVTELSKMLDVLLPEGEVFMSRYTDGTEKHYTSDADWVELPLAVLVNGDSYSAAEFFAAQLQESDRALVVGTATVGKGYFQHIYELADGSALGLSSGTYYTANGTCLQNTGVTPDLVVDLSEEDTQKLRAGTLEAQEDAQVRGAVGEVAG